VREKLTVTVLSSPAKRLRKQSSPSCEQPEKESNCQPGFALGVSLIETKFVPGGIEYVSMQSVPQLMPAGSLVTTPPGCAVTRSVARGVCAGASSGTAPPTSARTSVSRTPPKTPATRPILPTRIDITPDR
jgi:hypothetical protein